MQRPERQLSLRGLRTFCIAARTLNYREAAERLHVTPSAISHQIKRLEQELGVTLFNRDKKRLTLSKDGAALYEEVGPLLKQLDQAARRFYRRHHRPQIKVSVQPFFASELFVPRLAEFAELHPDLDIIVDTSDETIAHHPETADASIRLFYEIPRSLHAIRLFPLRLVGACSKALAKRLKQYGDEIDPAISLIVHDTRPDAWQLWHEQRGQRMASGQRIVQLDSMIAVLRAAERGLGIALVPLPLAQQWFDSGAVERFGEQELITSDVYHFVYDPSGANVASVELLRDWVVRTFIDE